ncbi:heme lyase NrfEFG subunit NrfF [Gallibacterium anatis]|uniref:Formate-dependent nitrite reductase complex subunit n=1 Tax=Gallibacterium anatis TaxID=750 RepID=A0A0A3ABL9_9PAST|nr:heme lyase NrfEFG subunit NrfF [Gallibacterium anatis]KGQ26193.1 cytochrome C biosynthesis protein [Gallibacterium anatis CCM5995]KGQ26410.1 cytochrome C biosynthesis protein [Gallibacterium anatis]KGQ42505.1 cytochrome C biosynthesis protein [Gallibacterium anatis IPDH697-78]KGQ44242.1 cytochrome C biosynthesis protein [Gallibacterium anatis]KGQ46539.1 cytochrome C biosynthesis protein [Gallibacterium anatis]
MKKFIFLLLCCTAFARAEIVETFQFHSEESQQRAISLAKTLRCPQCQNQNLVESNAEVAAELRLEVYKMVNQGKSNDEIIQIMTQRFGDFVRYDPPFTSNTFLLWLIPLVAGIIALFSSLFYLKKRREITLDPQQQQKIADFLQQREQNG